MARGRRPRRAIPRSSPPGTPAMDAAPRAERRAKVTFLHPRRGRRAGSSAAEGRRAPRDRGPAGHELRWTRCGAPRRRSRAAARTVEAQHKRGSSPRESARPPCSRGSFVELDHYVEHRVRLLRDGGEVPGDGVVTGRRTIEGSRSSSSADSRLQRIARRRARQKICKVMEARSRSACRDRLNDSGGARIRGVASLGGYAPTSSLRNTLASGLVPQISASWALRGRRGLPRRRSPTSS